MPQSVDEEILKTLHSGYISEGQKVVQFEKDFGNYIKNPIVASTNSCTSSLFLSLICAGVKAGDEVITSPFSCLATNIPILHIGANAVWADIDPATGNIDPNDIRKKITTKTKAILYVHWAGQPAMINEINSIAKENGIAVIEDAAHALGSEYQEKKIGNHADYVCFSFQAIKTLTTGDGGMIAFNGDMAQDNHDKLCKIRWFGLDRKFNRSVTKWETDVTEIGYKMHMNDISATIGIEQLKYIDSIVSKITDNAIYFDKELKNIPGITLVERDKNTKNAAWLYSLFLDNSEEREKFAKHMIDNGVSCNVVHVRNDKYSVFKKFQSYLPGVDEFSSRMINIPCGWWLTEDNMIEIVQVIKEFSKKEYGL